MLMLEGWICIGYESHELGYLSILPSTCYLNILVTLNKLSLLITW